MKQDLRKPTFVLVGAWNPAIFQPSWLAKYALGTPEGQNVPGAEVIAIEPTPSSIFYLKNTGFRITNQRADIFLNSDAPEDISTTELAAFNIVNTLPHTPFGPFGINYTFIEEDPDAELLDKLKSKDGIDQHFQILEQSFSAKISMDNGVILNLARKPSENSVTFDFNYHHEKIDQSSFEDDIKDKYTQFRTQSLQVLSDLYDINECEGALRHNLNDADNNPGEQ